MTRARLIILCLGLGCATSSSSEHLAYVPSPEAVIKPQELIERIITATPGATVTFEDAFFVVHEHGTAEPTRQMVRYDGLDKVELFSQTNDGVKVFGVVLTDKKQRSMFQWATKSRGDAQKLADAISVLASSRVQDHDKKP